METTATKELCEKLEQGLDELFNDKQFKMYLKLISKFYHYSYRNVILILSQCPDATAVAGYVTWQNEYKRQVKKGEKGIGILAPCTYKKEVENIKKDDSGNPILVDGKIEPQRKEVHVPYYRKVTIFDISQTEGPPLPQYSHELKGNLEHSAQFLEAIGKQNPDFRIEFLPLEDGSYGRCIYGEKKIEIKEGLSPQHTIKTAVHEIAHSLVHGNEERKGKSRNISEVEAEAIAYIVCSHFGIDTSDYSFGYIAEWAGTKEVIHKALDQIQKTSEKMINGIENELTKVREPIPIRSLSGLCDAGVGMGR